jgi:LPXTG-motif cell wall-anchored protein
MNRTLKRVLGLSGSVVLGLAGAVTFASAAQAHHPSVSGFSECAEDGGWTITWLVEDWEGTQNAIGTITAVEGDLDDGGEIIVGATLPATDSEDTLVSTQTFTADQTEAVTLSVSAEWDNGAKGTTKSDPVGPPVDCEEPSGPPVGGFVDCVGIEVWAWNEDSEELTVEIYVGDELVETFEWVENALCNYVAIEADCEGLIVTLTVPADGEETYFELWTSLSDEPTEVTLAPGASETFTFKAEGDEELWVDYYIETPKDATSGGVYWIPCDEETPSPSGTPSAQPQLPTTGSSMTIMIGSAAALIVAAAAIFLIMRRRRAAQDW